MLIKPQIRRLTALEAVPEGRVVVPVCASRQKVFGGRLATALVALLIAVSSMLVVGAGTSQAAPSPRCVVTDRSSILGTASGGCDGYGGAGHDRLVVQCNGMRGTIIYMSGRWMHRNQSWWYRVNCPGGYGYRAVAASFEHVNW